LANIYESLHYRKWIRSQAEDWKKSRPGHTLSRLAQQTGIQPPYLTNVLKERAHLNADQFYSVAKAFALNRQETEYGLMLLEWERSSLEERKQALKQQIEIYRKEKLKTENHLQAQKVDASEENMIRFYSNPELVLVHAFLGVPRYAQNLKLIADSLKIEMSKLEELLKELKDYGLIQVTAKGTEKTGRSLHLSKTSAIWRSHQLLMQFRSLQRMQQLQESERYNFSVTFTADEKTREKIHREFLALLSKVEKLVKEAPSEEVYQMHFDLFPWGG